MIIYSKNSFGVDKLVVARDNGYSLDYGKYLLSIKYNKVFNYRRIAVVDFYGISLPMNRDNSFFMNYNKKNLKLRKMRKEDPMPRYIAEGMRTVKSTFTIPEKYLEYLKDMEEAYHRVGENQSRSQIVSKMIQYYIQTHGNRLITKELESSPSVQEVNRTIKEQEEDNFFAVEEVDNLEDIF